MNSSNRMAFFLLLVVCIMSVVIVQQRKSPSQKIVPVLTAEEPIQVILSKAEMGDKERELDERVRRLEDKLEKNENQIRILKEIRQARNDKLEKEAQAIDAETNALLDRMEARERLRN